MTLDQAIETYFNSTAGDWHQVSAPLVPETNAHEVLHIYKPDVSLVLGEGHAEDDLHTWDWVNVFPDHSARNFYIDLLYNGVPIYRQLAVSVDGGRADLPSPAGYVETEKPESGWRVDRGEYEFVRHFSVIRGRENEFDTKFKQAEQGAGVKVI
jgi:hypothetical protein